MLLLAAAPMPLLQAHSADAATRRNGAGAAAGIRARLPVFPRRLGASVVSNEDGGGTSAAPGLGTMCCDVMRGRRVSRTMLCLGKLGGGQAAGEIACACKANVRVPHPRVSCHMQASVSYRSHFFSSQILYMYRLP